MTSNGSTTNLGSSVIHIDCDKNYFNALEQIRRYNTNWFTDAGNVSKLSGSTEAAGLFSYNAATTNNQILNSNTYATSSVVFDSSGAPRPILSPTIDIYDSPKIDSYRNGVEITQQEHWTAGLVKITAGNPGHLFHVDRYGDNDDLNLFSDTTFIDTNNFSAVEFISSGGDDDLFTYPFAVYPDVNPQEVMDGILEPFTLRPIINKFSIDLPEKRGIFGDYSCGNLSKRKSSDQILTVDYYNPKSSNKSYFLDGGSVLSLVVSGTKSSLGRPEGYICDEYNLTPPFEDAVYPGGIPFTESTMTPLSSTLNAMAPGGTTYVTWKQQAATSGHVFDDVPLGTDSIAFGGLLADKFYESGRITRRRGRRSVMNMRDSQPFISHAGPFNEKTMLTFVTQSIQYPEMLPVSYLTSSQTPMSSSISKLYHTGSIVVGRSYLPGMFDSILNDMIAKDNV